MSTDEELFTPEEVLGDFSAKRARLLLFQIESWTAYLMTQARRTVHRYLTEEAAEQQDLAFFEALAYGLEPPHRRATSRSLLCDGEGLASPVRVHTVAREREFVV